MLSYLLVALGGAIGSVLRAWLGTLVVSFTGPAFPWGTLLINVLGSLAIGFFATLTATDGRYGAGADLRTFVMVGMCGGFTTFSSFSLQTLELARDGRAGQALANVALSVVLCLASVSAGYALAMQLRTRPMLQVGAAGGGVVATLHDPAAAPGVLSVLGQLLADGEGPATVLAVEGPALASFQPTEEVMTRDRRLARRHWIDRMRPMLDGWVAERRDEGRAARWIAARGDGTAAMAEHGAGARLMLMQLDRADPKARRRVHAALVRLRRPVLLLPPGSAAPPIGRVAAVAWSADGGAAAAMRAARPLLDRAQRVVMLRIGDGGIGPDAVPAGSSFENRQAPPDGDPGSQLLAMAADEGADLLVMGAYHRGRLREALFDGATEHVLRAATMPVLMAHASA